VFPLAVGAAIGGGIAISAVAITVLDRDDITSPVAVSPLAMAVAIACRMAVAIRCVAVAIGCSVVLETVNITLQTVPATMENGTTETGKASRSTQAGEMRRTTEAREMRGTSETREMRGTTGERRRAKGVHRIWSDGASAEHRARGQSQKGLPQHRVSPSVNTDFVLHVQMTISSL
jgi:hypothetical protein